MHPKNNLPDPVLFLFKFTMHLLRLLEACAAQQARWGPAGCPCAGVTALQTGTATPSPSTDKLRDVIIRMRLVELRLKTLEYPKIMDLFWLENSCDNQVQPLSNSTKPAANPCPSALAPAQLLAGREHNIHVSSVSASHLICCMLMSPDEFLQLHHHPWCAFRVQVGLKYRSLCP